jgi:hypothetical protein
LKNLRDDIMSYERYEQERSPKVIRSALSAARGGVIIGIKGGDHEEGRENPLVRMYMML